MQFHLFFSFSYICSVEALCLMNVFKLNDVYLGLTSFLWLSFVKYIYDVVFNSLHKVLVALHMLLLLILCA